MVNLSLAGIVVAVVAVIAAYHLGYTNGVALGRDEGYNDGKRDGSREGSIRAYAVGFDRGKRNRESDNEDDDDDADSGGSSNWGYVILAVTAGMLVLLWLSSQSTTPTKMRDSPASSTKSGELPAVRQTHVEPSPNPAATDNPLATDTLPLPRVNRSLPTASPVPADPYQPQSPAPAAKTGDRSFPHPPPAFRQPP